MKKLAPTPIFPLPVLETQPCKDRGQVLTVLFPRLIMYRVSLMAVMPVGVLKIGGDKVQLLRLEVLLHMDTVSFAEFDMYASPCV